MDIRMHETEFLRKINAMITYTNIKLFSITERIVLLEGDNTKQIHRLQARALREATQNLSHRKANILTLAYLIKHFD